MRSLLEAAAVIMLFAIPGLALWQVARSRRAFGSPAERATLDVLEQANRLAPPFRQGLTRSAAEKTVAGLLQLLGATGVVIVNQTEVLASDGPVQGHLHEVMALAEPTLRTSRSRVAPLGHPCADQGCTCGSAMVVAIEVDGDVAGALVVLAGAATTGLIRISEAVAHWIAIQVELAELDRSKTRLAEAELRALRAQISPHFVYNALSAIASFVRSDPGRARELLLEFAEFTRYSLQSHNQFATLADELLAVDHYLDLERARFGERLRVRLRIAPEVLGVSLPAFVVQPLVENAVRHGIGRREGTGVVTIVAEDLGDRCRIVVEDDGVGMDPERLRAHLAGEDEDAGFGGSKGGMGLLNVDERLRQVFGSDFALSVDTAPGAGTKVTLKVPKYRRGVRAS